MPPADCPSRAGAPSPDHVNTAMFAATPAALPLLRRAAQMLERRPDLAGDQEAVRLALNETYPKCTGGADPNNCRHTDSALRWAFLPLPQFVRSMQWSLGDVTDDAFLDARGESMGFEDADRFPSEQFAPTALVGYASGMTRRGVLSRARVAAKVAQLRRGGLWAVLSGEFAAPGDRSGACDEGAPGCPPRAATPSDPATCDVRWRFEGFRRSCAATGGGSGGSGGGRGEAASAERCDFPRSYAQMSRPPPSELSPTALSEEYIGVLAALHRGECDGSASVLRSLGSYLSHHFREAVVAAELDPLEVRDTLKVWLVVSSALPVPDLWSAASAALEDGRCAAAAPPPATFHAVQSESSEPLALLGRELERFSLGVLERLSRLLRLAGGLGAEAPVQSYPEFIGNVRLESMSIASASLSVAGSVLAYPPLTVLEVKLAANGEEVAMSRQEEPPGPFRVLPRSVSEAAMALRAEAELAKAAARKAAAALLADGFVEKEIDLEEEAIEI